MVPAPNAPPNPDISQGTRVRSSTPSRKIEGFVSQKPNRLLQIEKRPPSTSSNISAPILAPTTRPTPPPRPLRPRRPNEGLPPSSTKGAPQQGRGSIPSSGKKPSPEPVMTRPSAPSVAQEASTSQAQGDTSVQVEGKNAEKPRAAVPVNLEKNLGKVAPDISKIDPKRSWLRYVAGGVAALLAGVGAVVASVVMVAPLAVLTVALAGVTLGFTATIGLFPLAYISGYGCVLAGSATAAMWEKSRATHEWPAKAWHWCVDVSQGKAADPKDCPSGPDNAQRTAIVINAQNSSMIMHFPQQAA